MRWGEICVLEEVGGVIVNDCLTKMKKTKNVVQVRKSIIQVMHEQHKSNHRRESRLSFTQMNEATAQRSD